MRHRLTGSLLLLLLLARILVFGQAAVAQADPRPPQSPDLPSAPDERPGPADDDPATMFPRHFLFNRLWISGQANVIEQWHGTFHSPYRGQNSLHPHAEHAASRILTLYTAFRLTNYSDVVFDLEDASGNGLSNSVGMAGYPNIDVVRVPGEGSPLSTAPYVPRAMFRQIVPLSQEKTEAEPGPLGALTNLPMRRLEFRAGTFALADFFDVNSVGSDSHLQFMNWATVNNGAWDYAADTRGYTWGLYAEYHDRSWSLRFAEGLMPKVANGIDLVWNLHHARAHNLELELRPHLVAKRRTAIRFLGYRNIADMGNYRQAIRDFFAGVTPTPDIVNNRRPARTKNGAGFNMEQEITPSVRAFFRLGWNDGHNESFAYTEIDRAGVFGADFAGELWHRKHDKIGAAFVVNGLSTDHRQYLALGGLGFLIGDGRLNYAREKVLETYYNLHVWRGIFTALDLQYVRNPGYNRDRGPVVVPAIRLHVDL
jgi:high affinity Mn2+ porin